MGQWLSTDLSRVVTYVGRAGKTIPPHPTPTPRPPAPSRPRYLDELGYTCFWSGRGRLWRVTGCFDKSYDESKVRAVSRVPLGVATTALPRCVGCSLPSPASRRSPDVV